MSWKKENLPFNFSEILSDLFVESVVWVQDIYICVCVFCEGYKMYQIPRKLLRGDTSQKIHRYIRQIKTNRT
jgi:hypothetical protein